MSSRIQSVSLAVGEPVMAIAPQLYASATVTADTAGLDIDVGAGPDLSVVADLRGFRGAIVTLFHSPALAGGAAKTQYRLTHGDTDVQSTHTLVGSASWTLFYPGVTAGGTSEVAPTFLVDAGRVKRYLGVQIAVAGGVSAYLGATITPIGPLVARKSNLNQTTNLFAVASGDLTFPDLS